LEFTPRQVLTIMDQTELPPLRGRAHRHKLLGLRDDRRIVDPFRRRHVSEFFLIMTCCFTADLFPLNRAVGTGSILISNLVKE